VSKYIGVSVTRHGSWKAQIRINGRKEHLGSFKTDVEAARAYDERAKLIPKKAVNFRECDLRIYIYIYTTTTMRDIICIYAYAYKDVCFFLFLLCVCVCLMFCF
jgi:hypothetical protein